MNEPQSCHLKLAGFELTILGRQFPDSHDVWDGNWLNVVCRSQDARLKVKATGPFLNVDEIADLHSKLMQVSTREIDRLRVEIMEPTLNLSLSMAPEKQILLHVDLQPDGKKNSEHFEFSLNHGEIDVAIIQCQAILRAYPMRGV
jgi:hypothetical protein